MKNIEKIIINDMVLLDKINAYSNYLTTLPVNWLRFLSYYSYHKRNNDYKFIIPDIYNEKGYIGIFTNNLLKIDELVFFYSQDGFHDLSYTEYRFFYHGKKLNIKDKNLSSGSPESKLHIKIYNDLNYSHNFSKKLYNLINKESFNRDDFKLLEKYFSDSLTLKLLLNIMKENNREVFFDFICKKNLKLAKQIFEIDPMLISEEKLPIKNEGFIRYNEYKSEFNCNSENFKSIFHKIYLEYILENSKKSQIKKTNKI